MIKYPTSINLDKYKRFIEYISNFHFRFSRLRPRDLFFFEIITFCYLYNIPVLKIENASQRKQNKNLQKQRQRCWCKYMYISNCLKIVIDLCQIKKKYLWFWKIFLQVHLSPDILFSWHYSTFIHNLIIDAEYLFCVLWILDCIC